MRVSRTAPEPLYHQVVGVIRRRITDGEWEPGQRVPSERALSEILGVSRITVRHAVRLACEEGLLEQRPGVGTFVAGPGRSALRQDLSDIRSFGSTLAGHGHVASTEILTSETRMNDLAMAAALRMDPSEPLYNLRLLGRGDSTPVVLYDSYFALSHGEQVAASARTLEQAGRPFSTLDLYREGTVSRRPTALSQTIEAQAAGDELAELFVLQPGAPLLAVESVMSDDEGPLEFRRAYYRADRYRFIVNRPLDRILSG
ncbi:MAG TPA: GntR family transcriptional regulator [Beutenbergiaceae bacterium]|nr:GntR family transcriptional regulator [Beutenbergiaceae bacterium]